MYLRPLQSLTRVVRAEENVFEQFFVVGLYHIERYPVLSQPGSGLEHRCTEGCVSGMGPVENPFAETRSIQKMSHWNPCTRNRAMLRRRLETLGRRIEVDDVLINRRGWDRCGSRQPRGERGKPLLAIDHP